MLKSPAHFFAFGFGSGLSPLAPVAPGTVGTFMGWGLFVLINPWLTETHWLVLLLAAFGLGVWACQTTGQTLGVPDHSRMVWDEIVAIWLVLFVAQGQLHTWQHQLYAVLLFRVFDIVKPPPIGYLDARFKNGFGVMLDDLVAAWFTLLVLAWVLA
jgi:phosphatidylglycerophosphatase A